MKQYIDKSAIVAEIEKLISNGQTKLKESEECKDYENYVALAERIATCINVLSFLDTLEVKDVDLEKEIRLYKMRNPIIGHREESLKDYMSNVAKYFFGLGLKVDKGE